MKNPEAQGDVSLSQGIRMMFYVMKPNETSFQTLEEVPDYVKQVRLSWKRLLLLFLKKSSTSWGLVYFHSLNYEILIKLNPFIKTWSKSRISIWTEFPYNIHHHLLLNSLSLICHSRIQQKLLKLSWTQWHYKFSWQKLISVNFVTILFSKGKLVYLPPRKLFPL